MPAISEFKKGEAVMVGGCYCTVLEVTPAKDGVSASVRLTDDTYVGCLTSTFMRWRRGRWVEYQLPGPHVILCD